jgi:predicted metalloendopeptidase
LNYGALGVVAGHEISHGFDNQGAGYGADGALKNWWSADAKKKFNEKAKCFENQYSAITDKQTGLQLNGKMTLGENIADNGGVHLAFGAYRNVTKDVTLPGLDFNRDQLFFLGHANVWCLNARDEFVRNQIKYNVHSLGRYRVNVPLMNSQDFANAFNCKKGSKMNPDKKCTLW